MAVGATGRGRQLMTVEAVAVDGPPVLAGRQLDPVKAARTFREVTTVASSEQPLRAFVRHGDWDVPVRVASWQGLDDAAGSYSY